MHTTLQGRIRRTACTAVAVALASVAMAGCGGSHATTHSTTTSATSASGGASTAAARATVIAWGRAATPQAICALVSYGYKLGVGRCQSPARCPSWAGKRLGPFTASPAQVISPRTVGDQTAVTASFSGHRQTLFLTRECGALKVASINRPHLDQPHAPKC